MRAASTFLLAAGLAAAPASGPQRRLPPPRLRVRQLPARLRQLLALLRQVVIRARLAAQPPLVILRLYGRCGAAPKRAAARHRARPCQSAVAMRLWRWLRPRHLLGQPVVQRVLLPLTQPSRLHLRLRLRLHLRLRLCLPSRWCR